MSFGNTVKGGTGTSYWLLQNADGQLVVVPGWVPDLDIDVTADDSDKLLAVTAGKEWIIDSIWVKLTTTSDVGNRLIVVQIQDGSANILAQFRAGATQAASLTRYYLFAPHVQTETAFIDTDYLTTAMPEMHLPAGYGIRVLDSKAIAAAADDMEVTVRYRERTA